MSRRISPGLDDKPIELNEDERKVVEALNMKLWAIQLATMKEKAQFLREVARRQGLIAPTLKELKSESGKPFVERKIKGIRRGCAPAPPSRFSRPSRQESRQCQGFFSIPPAATRPARARPAG